jgi:hypothetical protein
MDANLLAIYLRDHLAGSRFGFELASRIHGENGDQPEFEPVLAQLREQIAADRDALLDVMRRLGISPDPVKDRLAWAAEKAGRLKLNGRLRGYSPLSRLLELESLAMGILGKRSLWRSLVATHGEDPRLAGVELDLLTARADAQLAAVETLRTHAALLALR